MRSISLLLAGASVVALSAAAVAQDMTTIRRPRRHRRSDDAKFIAYTQPVIAFTHAEIVDGTGATAKYDQTLIVKDGRIAAIGAHVAVPKGATVVDARQDAAARLRDDA